MIKTTLGTTLPAIEMVKRLLERDWPAATVYRLTKLHRQLLPEVTQFLEQRQALAEKYGTQKDGAWVIERAKLRDLEAIPVTLDGAEPLPLSIFDGQAIPGDTCAELWDYLAAEPPTGA